MWPNHEQIDIIDIIYISIRLPKESSYFWNSWLINSSTFPEKIPSRLCNFWTSKKLESIFLTWTSTWKLKLIASKTAHQVLLVFLESELTLVPLWDDSDCLTLLSWHQIKWIWIILVPALDNVARVARRAEEGASTTIMKTIRRQPTVHPYLLKKSFLYFSILLGPAKSARADSTFPGDWKRPPK